MLVENRIPLWERGAGWRLDSLPVLEIGRNPTVPAEEFTRIIAIFTAPDGRIIIADGADSPHIRHFSSAGTFLRAFGATGSGPGEFGAMHGLWYVPPDTLVAFDPGLLRVTYFGLDGEYRHSEQLRADPRHDPDRRLYFEARFADGTFLFRPFTPYPARGTREQSGRRWLAAVRATADGTPIDTIGNFPELDWIALSTGTITSPIFGKHAAVLVHDSLYYTGIGDDFTIDQFDLNGRHLRRIRRLHREREITSELLDLFVADFLANAPPARHDRDRRALLERSRPGLLPAYSTEWLVDRGGRLWVQHYLVRYPSGPEQTEAEWSIFGADGKWIGIVDVPASLQPYEIGEDYVLGIWRDNLGVETVRRYSLRKQ